MNNMIPPPKHVPIKPDWVLVLIYTLCALVVGLGFNALLS